MHAQTRNNPVKTRWRQRAALKDFTRNFFASRGYLECDTPQLVRTPGTEVYLNFFSTAWLDHQQQSHPLFLHSSPEIHLKKVLAQGEGRIFQLAKCFRNGGELSPWHHPEFTMLEWYEAGISYDAFMAQTETYLRETEAAMVKQFNLAPVLPPAFKKISVAEAFHDFAGLELIDLDVNLARKARKSGIISVRDDDDFDTAFFKILLEKVEPALTQMACALLYDYPASQGALAKVEDGVAKRFEVYLHGVELCNAFWELTDAGENKSRFEKTAAARQALNRQEIPFDDEFQKALIAGIPECCGNALGFDRWLALLCGDKNLDRVIPFRHSPPFQER